jgi:hypothetical protein
MPVESNAPSLSPNHQEAITVLYSEHAFKTPDGWFWHEDFLKHFLSSDATLFPRDTVLLLFFSSILLLPFCLPAGYVRPTGGFEDTQPSVFPIQNRCFDLQASSGTICTTFKITTFVPLEELCNSWTHHPLSNSGSIFHCGPYLPATYHASTELSHPATGDQNADLRNGS